MAQIFIYGNSIAYGAWDSEGGWANLLRKYFDKRDPEAHFIYNLGIPVDETAEKVLQRFESETKARFYETDNIFIFATGTNSAIYMHEQKRNRALPNEFEKTIGKLAQKAKKYSSQVVFVGLTPVDEKRVDPIPWYPEGSYKDKYITQYNNIIKKISKKEGVHFVEILDRFKETDYIKLLPDGVHPNTEGHKLIFKIVKDYLEKNKII